jgi:hypothetical protein
VELYNLESNAHIPLQWLYHFHHKMHISIFFTCNCERDFANTFAQ